LAAHANVVVDLLKSFAHRRPTRAGSLVITVFGDSIFPHGNSVGLVSLIGALEPFGLNARQLRTAVFRLVREGWLEAQQKGRRSFYSLTETGVRQFTRAARRIYAARRPQWDGRWTLVIPAQVPATGRETLRRELLWLGYGAIHPGVYAHPTGDRRSLDETLQERKLANNVVVLTAQTGDIASAEGMKELCRECWRLDQIAARYIDFLNRFRPALPSLQRARAPDPAQCFQLRTLLIHEYRRILLHDADLPNALLPEDWPGRRALILAKTLYALVQQGAVVYLRRELEAVDGPLPMPEPDFYQRFGGLARARPTRR
jgi:phenylacetic acid degradation operon negative regulatory protein